MDPQPVDLTTPKAVCLYCKRSAPREDKEEDNQPTAYLWCIRQCEIRRAK